MDENGDKNKQQGSSSSDHQHSSKGRGGGGGGSGRGGRGRGRGRAGGRHHHGRRSSKTTEPVSAQEAAAAAPPPNSDKPISNSKPADKKNGDEVAKGGRGRGRGRNRGTNPNPKNTLNDPSLLNTTGTAERTDANEPKNEAVHVGGQEGGTSGRRHGVRGAGGNRSGRRGRRAGGRGNHERSDSGSVADDEAGFVATKNRPSADAAKDAGLSAGGVTLGNDENAVRAFSTLRVTECDKIVAVTAEKLPAQVTDGPTKEEKRESARTAVVPVKLPAPPKHRKMGVPIILKRGDPVVQVQTAPHASAVDDADSKKTKTVKKTKPKKKKTDPKSVADDEADGHKAAIVVPVSTAEALWSLAAREVSITSATQVMMRRTESSASLTRSGNNSDTIVGKKMLPITKRSAARSSKGGADSDQKAARRFNNDVRECVEQSDSATLRELLHDRHNHKFALDPFVLETVLKAYVVAAMFDDALYCLRNCSLPGTLSTMQTERILTCFPQNLRNSSAFTAADMIDQLCTGTAFDRPTSRSYFLRIVRGIALEFLEEATSARDRICSAPCERLVRSGVCVVDARIKRGKKPIDLLVVPGDQLGVFVPDSMENRGIQAGDAVSLLPYAGPYPMSAESLDRSMIEATVTNMNPMVIRLQDRSNASLYATLTEDIPGNVYRIDKLANRMGFNRQLAAAVAIASPLDDAGQGNVLRDNRRPCASLIKAITAMDENIDLVMKRSASGSGGAGNFSNGLTSTAELCAQAVPWNAEEEGDNVDQYALRDSLRLALDKYGALHDLNTSQALAVEGAISNRLTLVQGPPGTGKTLVAIRIIEHWARVGQAAATKGEAVPPILATSDSNIAVDNLVEGCANVGLRVVRLGRPEAIRPELLRFCIDRPTTVYNSASAGTAGITAITAAGFKERMKQLKSAQVICCTCIGSGGDILDAMTFERVLVDEATQATEPAVLVPLMRGCRQLVLVGDHCQLPPTVLSTRAEEEGHGIPLFSRMVACGVPPFMLDTQYRMHPRIAMFPSDLFYGGMLKNGVSAPERRPLAGFPWPVEEFPVAFIPVKGVEMDDGVSKFNEEEAQAACNVLMGLLSGGQCTVSDIAVVTPYAAQARLIRRMSRRLLQDTGPPFIEVSSVDGFQGREKEAVVFSAVRSNDYGAIGFTSDWRRVNVSFTRARRALVVVGNDATLRRGDPDTWAPWLAWVDAHGVNMDKPGIPRGRYDPEQLRRVRGGTTAAEMLKEVLQRQQAQLKDAEARQEQAEKNTARHIQATDMQEPAPSETALALLEEDLARITNTDGNWDDADDEDDNKVRAAISHSASKATLASAASSNDVRTTSNVDDSSTGGVLDAWDL